MAGLIERPEKDFPINTRPIILVYGPPGSGKSVIGKQLAGDLGLPFFDLDWEIERRSQRSISEIFARQGESAFREFERKTLIELLTTNQNGVFALGGGALLDAESRSAAERTGTIVCLTANQEKLLERVHLTPSQRPLLSGGLIQNMENLLSKRRDHYASFPFQVDTSSGTIEDIAVQIQSHLGWFHITGMGQGYDVRVQTGLLDLLGNQLHERCVQGPIAIVSDEHVWGYHGKRAVTTLEGSGFRVYPCIIPPGETSKTVDMLSYLWRAFLESGLDRKSTILAFGGGVVGDLTGFAAATYLRGVSWINIPTSLVAMVDASIGGKTGIDLPEGKNLAGAFHPPRLVIVDPGLLKTLVEAEIRSGLAEVLKHGLISDEGLFRFCELGWEAVLEKLDEIIPRAISVKVRLVKLDPYEKGPRAGLNLGHTLGHALEKVSGYQLKHGEAVAIGMVAAAKLAERLEIAESGLANRISRALSYLNLPNRIPDGLNPSEVMKAMRLDKKRKQGGVQLVLPVRVGQVKVGVEVPDLGLLLQE